MRLVRAMSDEATTGFSGFSGVLGLGLGFRVQGFKEVVVLEDEAFRAAKGRSFLQRLGAS